MARCVFHPETGKDQGKTLAGRRNIDAPGGAVFEQTNRLIRERRALLGVEDLKHRWWQLAGGSRRHKSLPGNRQSAWIRASKCYQSRSPVRARKRPQV